MIVVITGGTGKVGSEATRILTSQGVAVRVLTRDASKGARLPEGATAVVGELAKPDTLADAFRGADGLFLITPLSQTETEEGNAGVEAAKAAGIRRIVYLSVAMPEGSTHIPHFASKIPIEEAVQESGMAWSILWPNNFFQNDLGLEQAITQYGVYPQPIGLQGMNRVDTRDIADAAANCLTKEGLDGQVYPVHGPDALNGPQTAEIYSRHLGREVRYGGDDLKAWSAQVKNLMPAWMIEDLVIMYEFFQKNGFRAPDGDFALQREAVGHDPRSFEAFVAEIAPVWKAKTATHA
jgi:uncharacterized protein YbjT (DUF2867 family)